MEAKLESFQKIHQIKSEEKRIQFTQIQRHLQKVPAAGRSHEVKPRSWVPGIAEKHGKCHVFATILWAHVSIFDVWPHLAFQILLLPINTARMGQKRERELQARVFSISAVYCRRSFSFFCILFSLLDSCISPQMIQRGIERN